MDGTTRPRVRGASRELQQRARELRREMTAAECVLWEALQGKALDGLRFRTQHPVGQFILDFYCASCRLVVEVDGGVHDVRQEEDAERTRYLEAYGLSVTRFRNAEVLQDLPSVLNRIHETCQARASERSPSDSPRIGG